MILLLTTPLTTAKVLPSKFAKAGKQVLAL